MLFCPGRYKDYERDDGDFSHVHLHCKSNGVDIKLKLKPRNLKSTHTMNVFQSRPVGRTWTGERRVPSGTALSDFSSNYRISNNSTLIQPFVNLFESKLTTGDDYSTFPKIQWNFAL